MELRHVVLILLATAASAQESVRHYVLDPTAVVTVRLAEDAPTTCVFPGPIAGLEGAGIDMDPLSKAPVLLSHREGGTYFSLRAKSTEASTGLNVLYAGHVYPLRLIAGDVADRTVTFHAPRFALEPGVSLIERAQTEAWRDRAPGALAVEPANHDTVTAYRNFTATLRAVYRYHDAHALVCHVVLKNPGQTAVTYDPSGLGLQLERKVWFATDTRATGSIPAQGSAEAWFVIEANLKPDAPFRVIVPAP
jgi:hypothetical protein